MLAVKRQEYSMPFILALDQGTTATLPRLDSVAVVRHLSRLFLE
jgi:hypothetical protein